MRARFPVDRVFFLIVVALVTGGFFIFSSASLGLLARDGAQYSSVAFSQLFFGIGGGTIALFILSTVNYRTYRPIALYLFIGSLILTLCVFIPGFGFEYGGARRWLSLFGFSFQPSELLKITSVIFVAAWLSNARAQLTDFKSGLIPFVGILAVIAVALLAQPDTDTFVVIALACGAMYLAAGAPWRDILIMGTGLLVAVALLAFMRPYVMDRMLTFLDPAADPLGSGYQIQQSLIAIGSGGIAGRGFGQSIQKFNYLPEPIGDSVFSVAAEEFGFIGSAIIVLAFSAFAIRGLKIASRTSDYFGGLLCVGIVILVVAQSFMNIASMVGIIPLSGMPLLFISHGGSAPVITLAAMGVVLNVARHRKTTAALPA